MQCHVQIIRLHEDYHETISLRAAYWAKKEPKLRQSELTIQKTECRSGLPYLLTERQHADPDGARDRCDRAVGKEHVRPER